MAKLLPLGPKPPKQLAPPPPQPSGFEDTIEGWDKKAKEHLAAAQANEVRLQELIAKQAELQPKPIKSLVNLLSFGVDPGEGFLFERLQERKQLKPDIIEAELAIERDDFYARLYSQVPIVISGGDIGSVDDILSILKPPGNLTSEELDEINDIISGMVSTLTGMPELAEGAEPIELPELVAPPTIVETPPTTIHSLTVSAIVSSLTTPKAPESVMTEEEWVNFMIESEQISNKADLQTVEFLQDQASSIVDEWQERNNMLAAYRSGIAEMPDYELADLLKEMVVQPGIGLLQIAGIYFEYVSAPLAGLIWKDVFRIRDIDVAYQRYKQTESTWQALGHAWEEWDAPGEGAAEWILKYMLMEGLTDPLTYVGWGIATKIAKPLGGFGRWVGWVERGIAEVLDIPFDMIKAGIRRLPKTVSQQANLAMVKATQYVDKAMTQRFGKSIWQMTMKEWDEGAEAFVKYALKNPMADNVNARAGRKLLAHVPVTEKEVLDWASRLGTTLTPDQITRQTIANVDGIFEDFFSKIGGAKKLLTNREAADELVRVLVGNFDDATSVIAGKILLERSRSIINRALSFGRAKTTFSAMRQLGRGNRKLFLAADASDVALAMKEMGRTTTLLNTVPIRIQKVWTNSVDKLVVRPFAEAYLTFALYGPMNVIEDVIRTTLGGVRPGSKSSTAFARRHAGISYDPALTAERSISETMGAIAAKSSSERSNWILQLAFLGNKGLADKTFDILVRKPGQIGMAMRRHFVDAKYTQIMKELGGESLETLANVGPDKLMGVTNKRIVKEVQQAAMELKMNGLPDALRASVDDFTRAKILRREVDDILLEHPDLPTPVRDFVTKQQDDNILFRDAGNSIDNSMRDANNILLDDFIASPERATAQFEQLADLLVQFDVRNPQEMAQLIQSLNLMSSVYGATPKQILGRAVERTRGLPFANRRTSIDKTLDTITLYVERAGADIDRVVQKIKLEIPNIYKDNPAYISSSENLFNLQTAKRLRAGKLGEQVNAWRHDFFAAASPADLRRPEFWDDFAREINGRYHASNIEMADFDGMIKNAIDDLDIAGGLRPRQRPAIKLTDRELAPNDVAQLIGARGDDISRGLMDVLTSQNDKDMFTSYVMAHVRPDDVGFTKESVGAVYDQIVLSLQVDPKNMSWVTGKQMELDAVRRDLHTLYNSKMLPDDEVLAIRKYFNDTADAVQEVMYAPARGKQPPKLKEQFTGYNDLRQQAMDESQKWYYKEFTDYTNANAFDSFMKSIYPFWCMPEYATILTRTGWRHYTDLIIGEDVLTVDPETLVTRWEPVQEIASFDYDDDLMVIPAKGKDIEFTPNHRWLVVDKLTGMYKHIKRGYQLTDGYDVIPRSLPHEFLRESILSPRDAAILGWCCTDGYVNRGDGRKPHMIIYQSLHKYLLEIQKLTGVSGRPRSHTGYSTENSCDFSVRVANLDNDRILTICPDWSHLPRLVTMLSKESAEAMWDTMFKGEGSTHIEYTGMENSCWKQSPGPVMEAFQILSILLGKAITIRNNRVNLLANHQPYQGKQVRRLTTKHYKGKVWCPVTKSGTWFVNCNGSVVPTGNTYESQRWFWLPRSFIRHPGTFTAFERWQDNTDYGYIHIPGTSVDINPFRGTVYGVMSTRLARRDYPEYYDSLGAAGDVIEFNDFLSRWGFYPGAHIGIPLTIFGGVEMQFGEAMPSVFKTPLDILIAMFPDNEAVRWISDRVFGDRFRKYLEIIQINRRGGDGSLIYSKRQEGIELTEEEQQLLTDARREVGWYSAGFEQFTLFRMRTGEQHQMYDEASKVIEEMTGYTPDQQRWLRQHGYRLWDMVGGMSPSEQAILQEMDYYKWVGQIRPLLPGKQQDILNKIELAWNQVEKYTDQIQITKIQLQREFLSGQRGPDDYRSMLLDTYDNQREFIDNKIEEYPLMALENRAEYYKKYGQPQPVLHPMRELMNLYFSIELLEITDPETGEKRRDWDNFWAQRQAIEEAIPDEFKQEWEDFLSKNSTRMEQVRRDVSSTYFRTYNKVWEKILSTYSEEEQALVNEYLYLERTGQQLDRQAEIKVTKSEKTGNLLISSFRSEVSDAKKALRYANPHLDAWLFYWGRTSTFVAPGGEDVYKQIAAETGRRI